MKQNHISRNDRESLKMNLRCFFSRQLRVLLELSCLLLPLRDLLLVVLVRLNFLKNDNLGSSVNDVTAVGRRAVVLNRGAASYHYY